MDLIRVWLSCVWKFFNIPITIFGYTFTFWQIILFGALGGIFAMIVKKLIGGDVG